MSDQNNGISLCMVQRKIGGNVVKSIHAHEEVI